MPSPVEITVGAATLRGQLHGTPTTVDARWGVLFLHGWDGRPHDTVAAELVAAVADAGFLAMTVAFRGHGESDGDRTLVSRHDALVDALAAHRALRQWLGRGAPIIVVGSSYGAYIGVLLSARCPVAGLSLRVPAAYPDEGFERPQCGHGHDDPVVRRWRLRRAGPGDARCFAALAAFAGPVQILEAEHDEEIPRRTVRNYCDVVPPARLDHRVMAGWPHSLGEDVDRRREWVAALGSWLGPAYRR